MEKLSVFEVVIIIPTHSSYIDIVMNFLELLKKYWKDCRYKIIISVCGDYINNDNLTILYNGQNANLIDCLVNARKVYHSNYYICFLGDAFITKKILQKEVDELLEIIYNNNVEYCSLLNVKAYKKEKSFNCKLRYINSKDRYSHNFVSFIASDNYINSIISKCKSDLDFELMYLQDKQDFYYNFDLIFKKNYFGIMPGITKGRWNKIILNKLKKDNPDIKFAYRESESYIESFIYLFRNKIISYIPSYIRNKLKKVKFLKDKTVTQDI